MATILTKLIARKTTTHAQLVNLLATTVSALIIISCAIKSPTVLMSLMNLCIVMLMSAPKLKFISADISALIL